MTAGWTAAEAFEAAAFELPLGRIRFINCVISSLSLLNRSRIGVRTWLTLADNVADWEADDAEAEAPAGRAVPWSVCTRVWNRSRLVSTRRTLFSMDFMMAAVTRRPFEFRSRMVPWNCKWLMRVSVASLPIQNVDSPPCWCPKFELVRSMTALDYSAVQIPPPEVVLLNIAMHVHTNRKCRHSSLAQATRTLKTRIGWALALDRK